MRGAWLIARREVQELLRDPNLLFPLILVPCLMGFLTGLTALTPSPSENAASSAAVEAVLNQLPQRAIQRFSTLPVEPTPAASGSDSPVPAAPAPVAAPPLAGIRDVGVGILLKAVALPLFWIVAVALTPAVATDSFVGERERRTIEPLLAAPLRNRELFLGKLMAAIVPAVAGTWLGTLVFALMVGFSGSPYYPRIVLADRDWAFSTLVIVPLMTLLSAGVAAVISTRVATYRVAYQLSGLIVLPIILFMIPQAVLLFLVTPAALGFVAGGLLVLDSLVLAVAMRVFNRERLLGN